MARRKRQTVRDAYNKELKLLMRRVRNIAKEFSIFNVDIKIKPTGRVTKKDVEYIKSFKRGKLQEAVKTVDYGTGEAISVKDIRKAQKEAVQFSERTIDGWKSRVREMDGKLSGKLINFMDQAINRLGADAVAKGLAKMEAQGHNLSYRTVNYDGTADGYISALLDSVDELGADSFTRQELEQVAQDTLYDIPEEFDY